MGLTTKSQNALPWVSPYAAQVRRPFRTVVGAWMLLFDGARVVVSDPEAALDRVERRGLQVERTLESGLRVLEERGSDQLRRLTRNARHPVKWAQESISETGQYAEDELERQVQKALQRMGIPTRERLEKLGREIENLSALIDQELAVLMRKPEGA